MPTLAGFLTFLRKVVGIPVNDLPDNAPIITEAFEVSKHLVNSAINQASPHAFVRAVYNLGADYLINYAPDEQGCHYFENLRKSFKISQFTAGVVANASDEGTSAGLHIIEAAANFTLGNLQNLKTPYGRAYLAIAQSYGPTIWGLTT